MPSACARAKHRRRRIDRPARWRAPAGAADAGVRCSEHARRALRDGLPSCCSARCCSPPVAAATTAATATASARRRRSQAAPLSPTPQGPRDLPARIPLEGTVPGDPAAIKVIRLWSEAMRRSDVKAASALWAVPSKVQNGTPVLPLASAGDVRTFNGSLSCGSQLVSGLGAKGSAFIVAEFKLTKRPGRRLRHGHRPARAHGDPRARRQDRRVVPAARRSGRARTGLAGDVAAGRPGRLSSVSADGLQVRIAHDGLALDDAVARDDRAASAPAPGTSARRGVR